MYCLWSFSCPVSHLAAEAWSGGVGHHYAVGSCVLRKTLPALNLNCLSLWHFNPSKSFLHKWAGCGQSLVRVEGMSSAKRHCRNKCSCVWIWKVGAMQGSCSGLMRNMAFGLQVLNFHADFFLSNLLTPLSILILFQWIEVLWAIMLCSASHTALWNKRGTKRGMLII